MLADILINYRRKFKAGKAGDKLKKQKLHNINQYTEQAAGAFRRRSILVFGDGNTDSKIVLVGEARQNRSGTGNLCRTGRKNLEEFINILGISRKIYILLMLLSSGP